MTRRHTSILTRVCLTFVYFKSILRLTAEPVLISTFSAINQIYGIYASIIKIAFNKICPFRDLCIFAQFFCCKRFFLHTFCFCVCRAIAYVLFLLVVFLSVVHWTSELQISIPDFENPSIWRIEAVQIDRRIDISISIRSMIPKFGRQVHLEELTQMRLIN